MMDKKLEPVYKKICDSIFESLNEDHAVEVINMVDFLANCKKSELDKAYEELESEIKFSFYGNKLENLITDIKSLRILKEELI